ncbi:MAG: reprolysin-like metallopeptidase [Acidobacteriota bacterium]
MRTRSCAACAAALRALLPILTLVVLVTVSTFPAVAAVPSESLWSDIDDAPLQASSDRMIVPRAYRALALDLPAMERLLADVPLESAIGTSDARDAWPLLELPLPDGTFGGFRIVESPIMAPELAAKYPEIKTFRGQGIDDPQATLRFDLTPAGFHAMILSPRGDVYIDPYARDTTAHYISYRAQDAQRQGSWSCGVTGDDPIGPRKTAPLASLDAGATAGSLKAVSAKALSGSTLRTYRLAVAATGEYTAFHGGTRAQGQAAIVTAMNRVNGIYERDVAIRMVLVANNDQVVYTNGSTDPYTNNSGGTMLGQNQSNLDSVIGSASYDIGHVFSTGGGGIASLRVPCRGGSKARGVTGLGSPTGDPFWVDYVAHEMGHQWGGNHTFNGSAGSCAGGNRNGSTAYEPGSGTTIQAYAGICGSQNIQSNSDDHFHGISLDEIIAYSANGSGDNCPVRTATGNTPPSVNAGANVTIPLNTPFELCGAASDPNGDSLTYAWEQFDLGPAGAPNSPSGNAPIFRSFSPSSSPCRTFPQRSDLVNNTQTIGELLPTYGRTMNFRLTVRDNRSGGGGVADDARTVTAASGTGPFRVTAPNTAVTWPGGASRTVTWDVAGTDLSPISCSSVDITLSTDGGTTYGLTLASGVSNNGSRSIVVPSVATTQARVRVQCAGNVFFDISNANFTITNTGCTSDAQCSDGLFCNGVETCNAGSCQAGTPPCSGGQTCNETTDTCDDPSGCLHEATFESGASGWLQGNDNCATGAFIVGTPDATAWQVGGGNPGNAFYTQPNLGGLGTDDVDGGTCEALSPVVAAGGEAAVEVAFDYFHGQRDAGDDPSDGFTVELLNNGAVIENLVDIGDVTNNAVWTRVTTTVNNPGNLQLVVRATDGPTAGDIVEGGIDNVSICPAPPSTCTVEEGFESGATGWTNNSGSTCSTGDFVVGNPTNPGGGQQIVGSFSGTGSLFTAVNTAAGTDDVDGGTCILDSPTWSVANASTLSVWYWHGQRDPDDDPSGDFFRLEVSTDGGANWSDLASNGDSASTASWTQATAPIPAGSSVQLRVQCADGPSAGDLVECGIDEVSICE